MPILSAYTLPHPPLIVPEIGRGREQEIAATIRAYDTAARKIASLRPETVIVTSPHTVMYADYFHVSGGGRAEGDFSQFGAGQVTVSAEYDTAFTEALCRLADRQDFPLGTLGEKDKRLDHGVMVPLYFVNQYYREYRLVRMGLSGLPLTEHYRAGMLIKAAAEELDRRAVVIASGDLSHRLTPDGPYGYRPEGPEYDERIMAVLEKAAFGELFAFGEAFCEKAAECGHRSFVIMAGCLDGRTVQAEALSHEGPFGVGYGVCCFLPEGESPERRFLERYENARREELLRRRRDEDDYVRLARLALETYVGTGRRMEPEKAGEKLPEELKSRRAGVFVSLHRGGALRGCIGTIAPVTGSVAEEILRNAVSAATEDPRFPPVRKEELGLLEISVDVLGVPEPVASAEELDVKRYGVIVSRGNRRGLLLPDLEGVESVEQQVSIARRKAGIGEDEEIVLERFEVIRHGEKR